MLSSILFITTWENINETVEFDYSLNIVCIFIQNVSISPIPNKLKYKSTTLCIVSKNIIIWVLNE